MEKLEGLISKFQELPDKQKVALAGGTIVCLGLFLFLVLRLGQTNKPKVKPLPTAAVSFPVGTNPPQTRDEKNDVGSWQVYKGPNYKFSYPKDWKIEEVGIKNGGSGIYIKPSGLRSDEFYPHVVVEEIPSSNFSLSSRRDGFLKVGFSESKATLGSIEVSRFTAKMPFEVIGGVIKEVPLYSSLNLFEKGGNIFTVGYEMEYEKRGTEEEKLIEKIASTFTFTD